MKFPKLSKTERRLWETLVFVLKILAFSIPLQLIMHFSQVLHPFQELVASNVSFIFRLMGYDVVRNGISLTITGTHEFLFLITGDCTGWKSMILLCALIFAIPRVEMKKRLIGLIIGITIIYTGNLIRILLIVLAEQSYGLEAAMIIHDYLWQLGLVSLVIVIWVVWLIWNGKITFKTRKSKFKRKKH